MFQIDALLKIAGRAFESNSHACWGVDHDSGQILVANDAALGQFGHSRAELTAMTQGQLLGETGAPLHMLPRLAAIRHKDGALHEVELTSVARFELEGVDVELVQADNALAARLLAAEDAERRRVSRELHDQVNQQLALLSIDIDSLEQRLRKSRDEVPDQLQKTRDRLAAITADIRRVAYQLHPSVLDDLGLIVAVRALLESFGVREGIEVLFEHGALPPIRDDVSTCLYRVLQEALWNIARHAHANRVSVDLQTVEGAVTMNVTDDGVGFEPGARKGVSLGIVSMRERVALVRGTYLISSSPGEGTRLNIRVPLEAQ